MNLRTYDNDPLRGTPAPYKIAATSAGNTAIKAIEYRSCLISFGSVELRKVLMTMLLRAFKKKKT
jgi:hypothetical protein